MKHFKKLLLMLCLIVAGVQSSWAWINYHVEVQDNIPINGVVYQLCHVYTREGKLNREAPIMGGGYVEYSTVLTNEYYASVVGITGSGAIEIPDTILDGGVKYGVKYVGIRTSQGVESREETYTYEFFGSYTATTTCYYYTLTETPVSITASSVTKLTFKGNVTFKGNLTATACTSMEFKKGVTISSDLTCSQLTKFVFEGNFNCTKDNGAHLKCSNLTQIYFMGTTPTLSGSWSQYSTRAGSYITVYLNETQETCNYLKNNATVWNEFHAINVLPNQTVPYRNISISIKRGRVKVNNSSTYILKDTEYQVPQYSDFTFEVTKLYGSDYLVKSVKLNGVEILDAMTFTQKATDALSYYSYTISPVINDVYISVEGESIYNWAYAICGNGGTCRWSTQSSAFYPNSLTSTRWLKSSETPPSLIIIPNEGFTLDRFYYNSYDNTYRATDNGDGTFTYQMAADARASVVFKEIPPKTTWNVTLLNNEFVTAKLSDKRDDEYEYTLENGENEVIDNAKSMTLKIYNTVGTLMVKADDEDLSSYFEMWSEWLGEEDEYGNPITEDYYTGTIPTDKLKAKNWVIGLRTSNELVWTLKSSGDMGASCVNMLMSNGTASCTINNEKPIANSVISGSTNIPQTLQVLLAPNHSFTVSFNGTDYTEFFVQGETVNGLTFYTYTLNPTINTSLVADGIWLVTFTETPVGQPVDIIEFADANVKTICVANWDTDGDGELSKDEAAAVTTLKVGGSSPFKQNEEITSFDELQYFTGLTEIADSTFYYCKALTSVIIPKNVTILKQRCFEHCMALLSIEMPDGLTTIQAYSFWCCSKLPAVNIPNTVTSIGNQAFSQCNLLRFVKLPDNLTAIGNVFYYDKALQAFHLPAGVTSISNSPTGECTSLTSISVDSNNRTFDSRNGCNAVIITATNTLRLGCKNTRIPEDITAIGESAFSGQSITSIEIPEGVTSIGSQAFHSCRDLTSVVLPSTLESIANGSFYYCPSLKSMVAKMENPITIPTTGTTPFKVMNSSNCVLTVPKGKRDAYIAAGWTEDVFKGGVVEAEDEDDTERYDVNRDGSISIADVTTLVNVILGKPIQ